MFRRTTDMTPLQAPEDIHAIPQYSLSNAESARLANSLMELLWGCGSPYMPSHFERLWEELPFLIPLLSRPLVRALSELRCNPRTYGAMVIHNMPLDAHLDRLQTPPDGKRPQNKDTFVCEGGALLIARLLGEVYAYRSEKDGELIAQGAPVHAQSMTVSNAGSQVDLLLHTEDVHLSPLHPDYVLLFFLRADRRREAVTLVTDIRDVLEYLEPDTIEVLRQPWYVVEPPASFGGQGMPSAPMPILRGPAELPQVTVEFNAMTALNAEAAQAFETLKTVSHCPDVVKQVHAEPGDLIVLDNRRVVHGRNIWRPFFDGLDRWFQRLFVREDLFWASRAHSTTNPRVLAF